MMIYYVTIGMLIIAYSSAIITALVTINGKLDRLLDNTECLSADKPQESEENNGI